MHLGPYSKTVAAVVTAALTWAAAVVTSDPSAITASEWVTGVGMMAAALGVFLIPNAAPLTDADPGD